MWVPNNNGTAGEFWHLLVTEHEHEPHSQEHRTSHHRDCLVSHATLADGCVGGGGGEVAPAA